jgi:hypothetical protein
MGHSDSHEHAFDHPGDGFRSIFEAADALDELNGTSLSDLAGPVQEPDETERTTIYVSEEADAPPELDDLTAAVRDGWDVADISLGYRKSTEEYCFIISLRRDAPQSLFEIGAS